MDKSKGIAFFGEYLGGRKEQPDFTWCCRFVVLPRAELPQLTPANLSSLPVLAPTKSELPDTTNQLGELPTNLLSLGWGQQMGAAWGISEGHLQASQKEN